jgi:hypothetical protein
MSQPEKGPAVSCYITCIASVCPTADEKAQRTVGVRKQDTRRVPRVKSSTRSSRHVDTAPNGARLNSVNITYPGHALWPVLQARLQTGFFRQCTRASLFDA